MEAALASMSLEGSDEALALSARAGDRSAYAALVDRHREVVFSYACARLRNRDDAEDLTQEAFLRAYRSLEQYGGRGCWAAWLMRIVRNACTDADRKRRVRATEPVDDDWLDDAPTPELQALEEDGRRQLVRAVNSLPEQYRVPLVMHYWSRLTYRQIGLALGLRESTVVGRVAVALRRLRRKLPKEDRR
jgi:RNA polymerase sigma-70 factor, ECF subfamily